MGTIRLKNICKDFQLGIIPIVDYLNTLGAEIKDINPYMEVPMEYIPALKERFGQPQKEILTDNRPPINNPIRAKHRPGLFGKKILLLDGFYGTTSRDLRDYYIDGISNNDVFAEIPETLLAAGKTLCSLFGKQFDITEFMDNCAFYCCDKEDGVQDKDAHSRRRQKIDETVELLEPDIVIVLSKWVKDFLGMNSGLVFGKGHLLSKRIETANGFTTDFIYITDPFWLSEKDWEGFFINEKSNECLASNDADIYEIPTDIFTRKNLSQNDFIKAGLPEIVKSDMSRFKEFIKYVSSLSGCTYERADVETLLRIMTGYPFINDKERLIWDARNQRQLFYVMHGLFKGKHGVNDTIINTTDFINKKDKNGKSILAFEVEENSVVLSKYFTVQQICIIDRSIADQLHRFYPDLYKPAL